MNRIRQASEEIELQAGMPASTIEQATYTASGNDAHALFAPLHYEPGYAYPLIIWLHGPGDNEHQLKRVMPLVSMRNFVAAAPRGTAPTRLAGGRVAYGWKQTAEQIALAEQRVFACLETAEQKFNVAPDRVFLAGYDEGGTMAFRIATRHPHAFAGALSLGGAFPSGNSPLRCLNTVRKLPLFLACGTESQQYPADQVCRDLRLFHSAGLSVMLRQYPCADELTTVMLADMNRWIMEQVCPTSACPS